MLESSEATGTPVEFHDFRGLYVNYSILCALLPLLALIDRDPLGLILGGLLGSSALWSFQRLLSKRVRIVVSREGILEQNFWYSPGFIPWDQVLGFRFRSLLMMSNQLGLGRSPGGRDPIPLLWSAPVAYGDLRPNRPVPRWGTELR